MPIIWVLVLMWSGTVIFEVSQPDYHDLPHRWEFADPATRGGHTGHTDTQEANRG